MPESYRTGVTDAIYWSFPDCGPTASLVVAMTWWPAPLSQPAKYLVNGLATKFGYGLAF
jgi:hypothetical protein